MTLTTNLTKLMLALVTLLAFTIPTAGQTPLVELKDNKILGRTFSLSSDLRYKFFPFPGTRPSEGAAVLEKAPQCVVRFKDVQPSHTIIVKANSCLWTGTVTVIRVEFGQTTIATYELLDSRADKPPKN